MKRKLAITKTDPLDLWPSILTICPCNTPINNYKPRGDFYSTCLFHITENSNNPQHLTSRPFTIQNGFSFSIELTI